MSRRQGARPAEALVEVARLLAQTLDAVVVGQRIVESLRALLRAQSSILYRLDLETGGLAAVVCAGDAGPGFVPQVVLPAGTGIAGLAVRERAPQVSPHVLRDPRLLLPPEVRARIEQAPFRAALAVPLLIQERVVGVLAAYDADGRIFDDEAIRLGRLFADHAALALDLARIHQAAHREEPLHESQKVEAVGRLASGIAHEFNNLLTVITSRAELALQAFGEADPSRANLELIVKAADRGADLVRQLLAFSRRQVLQPKTLDLNAIVSSTSVLLRRLIGEHVELDLRLAAGLGRVRADPGQLEAAIVDLAVNARDAMPEGGTLTIATHEAEPSVILTVSDTGVGMDAETRAHVFEPFFTASEVGRGGGLGLATVQGIVAQNGGRIDVGSEAGRGTTFTIRFPRVDDVVAAAPASAESDGPARRETILLAEDDEEVRSLARQILESAGYTVMVAGDGTEALRAWEGHAGRIDVLLADVVMPRMGGFELARRLRTLRPELRVIYVSGYANDLGPVDREAANAAAYLQKPFNPRTLLQKVREVLNS